jgi:peptidyl-tRNA hydrolase
VLTPFDADERSAAETSLTRAAEAAEVALREGIQPAMTKFNG